MKTPNCVGIIMDGNRRWAKNKDLPLVEGHRAGAEKLKDVSRWVKEAGIEHLIVFTFSTENWNRSQEEVTYLMDLIGKYFEEELEEFNKENGIIHIVGEKNRFSEKIQKIFENAENKTKSNTGTHIYFALNYGGRQEILLAVKKIIEENVEKKNINEESFRKYLQTADMPDPDIIIRTSGEMRLSGFLPWQGVYSELFFTNTLWPDFSKQEFQKILEEYGERERRMGK